MRSRNECAQGLPCLAAGRRRTLHAWAGALLGFSIVTPVGGCGSDGAGAIFVDPGCLAARKKKLVERENELRGLLEKANESAGGAVIGSLAYRSDYESVLAEEKLLQRNAVEKNRSFAVWSLLN